MFSKVMFRTTYLTQNECIVATEPTAKTTEHMFLLLLLNNYKYNCPLWGLPSRVPQHRTHLGVFVCLLSVRILPDFYRMAYAPASNADAIRFIFRGVQKVSQKNRPLRKTGAIFRVPFFFELFLIFV